MGEPILGIDLGSHSSCICLYSDGRAEVIANELGNRATPTVIAFREDEVLSGETARNQAPKNRDNTFSDLRALVETTIQQQGDAEGEGEDTDQQESSGVYVPVTDKTVSVEELLSLFFRKLHDTVQAYVGKRVRECVLAVPTYFTPAHIDTLVEAAKQGGLRIKATISEPVAVCLAHELDSVALFDSRQTKRVVVYDYGWTSVDVTVLKITQGLITVEASRNERGIGGKQLVSALVELCAKEFQRKTRLDVHESKRSVLRLFSICEDAIKILSGSPQTTIDIDSLYEGCDFSYTVSRARFEDACMPVLRQILTPLNAALDDANVDSSDISCVLLAGGLSKVPAVQNRVRSYFPNAVLKTSSVDFDELTAVGAGLHAGYLRDAGALHDVAELPTEIRTLNRTIGIRPMPTSGAEPLAATPFLFESSPLPAMHSEDAAVPVAETAAATNVALELVVIRPNGETQVLAQACFDCEGCKVHDDKQIRLTISTEVSVHGDITFVVLGHTESEPIEKLRCEVAVAAEQLDEDDDSEPTDSATT